MLPKASPKSTFRGVLKDNKVFIFLFCLWLLVGGVLLAVSTQGEWIYFFNERRTHFWDLFFRYGTQFVEEYIFAGVFLFFILFVKFRAGFSFLLMALASLVVTGAAKQFFRHPRPLRYFTELGTIDELSLIQEIHTNSGFSSFPSGHTLAAFAIYGFLAFNAGHKRWSGIAFFAMAIMVGISRIYLVQHFLKDIYLGSMLGLLLAILFYLLQSRLGSKPWLDRNLLNFRKVNAKA